jgi:hypothetical protein
MGRSWSRKVGASVTCSTRAQAHVDKIIGSLDLLSVAPIWSSILFDRFTFLLPWNSRSECSWDGNRSSVSVDPIHDSTVC